MVLDGADQKAKGICFGGFLADDVKRWERSHCWLWDGHRDAGAMTPLPAHANPPGLQPAVVFLTSP